MHDSLLALHAVPSHCFGQVPEPRSDRERASHELAYAEVFARVHGLSIFDFVSQAALELYFERQMRLRGLM